MDKKSRFYLLILVEGAIMVAIAMGLAFIQIDLPTKAFDLSLGMIPITVYSVRRGARAGMLAGLVWGFLHIVAGIAWIATPAQAFIEYILAFAAAGLAGLYATGLSAAITDGKRGRRVYLLVAACVTGTFARWFCHFWAGVFFFGEYAPVGQSVYIYSLIANGASFIANAVLLIIIMLALNASAPRLLKS